MYILLKDKSGTPILLTRDEVENYGQRLDKGIDTIKITGENLTRPLYLSDEEFSLGKLRYHTFGTEKILDVGQVLKWDSFMRSITSKSDTFAFSLFFIIFASALYIGSGVKLSEILTNPDGATGLMTLNPGTGSMIVAGAIIAAALLVFGFWLFRRKKAKTEEVETKETAEKEKKTKVSKSKSKKKKK